MVAVHEGVGVFDTLDVSDEDPMMTACDGTGYSLGTVVVDG